jgi:phospholipase D1/2
MDRSAEWSRRKIVVWAAVAVATLAVVGLVSAEMFELDDLREMVERVRGWGGRWWAPLALIGAFIVINLVGIPGTPLTLAAGAVWGWLAGGAWVMAAVMIGTAVPYLIVKKGAPGMRRNVEARFGWVARRFSHTGITGVLLLRIAHVFPFAAVSYAAGLLDVRPRDYFAGTFLGTLPGVLVYTWLADSILAGIATPEEAARRVAIAAVAFGMLAVVTRLVARRVGGESGGSGPR